MGYTRYWERTNKAITEEFVKEVKTIIGDSLSKGIVICGWDGTGTPEITTEEISFNGNGSKNLDHETLFIGKETGFNFCKTACKPYDYTVRKVLRAALKEGLIVSLSDDGTNEEIISDEDYLKRYRR